MHLPDPFHRVGHFRGPQSNAVARFSVSYCAVTGLLTGHVMPEDFRPQGFLDPERQRLERLVTYDVYTLPANDPGDMGVKTPECLTVTLASGAVS